MRIRILSNFPTLQTVLENDPDFEHEYIGQDTAVGETIRMLWRARGSADFLVFNIDARRMLLACLLFGLTSPRRFRRCRIVSVDILLRPAANFRQRAISVFKRVLLKQVDLFILYFRNIDGYVRHFGIPRQRTAYVPFKVNSWRKLSAKREQLGSGDYALLSGATLRDHATFVDAVRRAGVPAVLLLPGDTNRATIEQMPWYRAGLPPNLRVEYHVDGEEETYLRYFEDARVVCFPRFSWDIASSGISGYLCSMALGRFVAISRGPGAEDVLQESGAAVFFDSGDSRELAR
jgi:glycosyltransferase involved in cell wall biosynthesis